MVRDGPGILAHPRTAGVRPRLGCKEGVALRNQAGAGGSDNRWRRVDIKLFGFLTLNPNAEVKAIHVSAVSSLLGGRGDEATYSVNVPRSQRSRSGHAGEEMSPDPPR